MGGRPQFEDAKWRSRASRAPEYLSIIDASFRLVYVNRDPGDAIGRSVFDFIAPRYHDAVRAAVRDARTERAPQYFESEAGNSAGRNSYYSNWVFPLGAPGAHDLFAFVGIDISHTRRVEEALAESETLLRSVLENVPDLITVVDREYLIQFVNRSRRGFTPASYVGRSLFDFIPAQHVERVRAAVDHVLETEQHSAYDLDYPDSDDDAIFHTRLGPVMRKGRVERVTLISTDVTAERRADEDRAALTAQLFQAQKMESLGKLTGGIAHDFNNLLTVILSCVELIGSEPTDVELTTEGIEQIRGATLRAADLTRRLLAFARRQALAPRVCDLNELIAEETPMLARALGEQVRVETDLGEALWKCRIDPGQLQSALLNVAINARDALPNASGTVQITSRNVRIEEGDEGCVPAGQWVVLDVRDNGVGMSPEVEKQALDPFFTTKGERGTGLGLSTVYGFVLQSGGHLRLESTEGVGTSVRMYFPRAREDLPTTTPPRGVPSAPTGERILLVEDDPSVRRMTKRLIERLGYKTRTAKDAIEAIEIIEESEREATPFAVVVTDVVLPRGMDGLKLRSTIFERWPGIEVVVVSGYATDALTDAQALDPTLRIVEKPFSKERLDAELREALARLRS